MEERKLDDAELQEKRIALAKKYGHLFPGNAEKAFKVNPLKSPQSIRATKMNRERWKDDIFRQRMDSVDRRNKLSTAAKRRYTSLEVRREASLKQGGAFVKAAPLI